MLNKTKSRGIQFHGFQDAGDVPGSNNLCKVSLLLNTLVEYMCVEKSDLGRFFGIQSAMEMAFLFKGVSDRKKNQL